MPDLDFGRAPRPGLFTLITAAGELMLVLVALLVVKLWRPGEPGPPLDLDLRSLGLGTLAALPAVALLFWLLSGVGRDLPFIRKIRRILCEVAGPTFAALAWWQMVVVALTAGIGEEILFRGALQPRLGLVFTSLLFGLLHPFSAAYAALASLFGAYLGWLARGNLTVPIVTHALYDLVALAVVRKDMRRAGET